MQRIGLLLVLLAVLATGAATAQTSGTSLQALVEQQEALRAQLTDGIDGVTPRQVRRIDKAQGEFFAIVKGKQALDELSIEEKIRVENALETINAQVAKTRFAADDQQVCWREAQVGSKMTVSRCASQKELEDETQSARDYMSKPRICVGACSN